jgi:SAM-dependent methyltransferase
MTVSSAAEVLRLVAAGDRRAAADRAAGSPGALCAALAAYLAEGTDVGQVYDEAAAFQAFISNGTNPALYERTSAALRAVHDGVLPRSVLDIGCGDGRVVAASLAPSIARVDLVEPAAVLLDEAVALVGEYAEVGRHCSTVEAFLAADDRRWDFVQSTFAMHNLAPDDRRSVWAELSNRTATVAIAEFDVPAFADRSAAHCSYLAERYAVGVTEYVDHPEVVNGFLMPVLVGQVAPDAAPRYTYEQPIEQWAQELAAAGFTVAKEPILPYWWADAWLLVGRMPVST